MTKEQLEKDIEAVKAAIDTLKTDFEAATDEVKKELQAEVNEALSEYSEQLEKLSELNATLKQKLGKYGRAFLYACVGILAIAGVDKAVDLVKGLF